MNEKVMNVIEFIEKNDLYAESFEEITDMYMKYRKYKDKNLKRFKMLKMFVIFQIKYYANNNKELFLIAGNEEV